MHVGLVAEGGISILGTAQRREAAGDGLAIPIGCCRLRSQDTKRVLEQGFPFLHSLDLCGEWMGR